ncbi:ATP-binding cassette domain-containing protein [Streptomyces sp. XM4193]|uniref:ATP-binding cassette domain-containing protein n=1 Tax=Streptomyces sp. XM4193 TaxID=2929782 RepID=UPI001FFAAD91|nr:ATP-binding cassette domain-containing protein [Streptomyces sp. XM4193]MCK1795345.1 ATP-binding cassette domain-containing protein [Streptomyces sp. XM4193]
MNPSEHAVLAEDLQKRYGRKNNVKHALDGFDLAVPTGTVHGLLGPNGAGKTTAVRVLATLLRPDGGRATVGGYDIATQPRLVRRQIGFTGQYAAVDEILTGRQNLEMFAKLFHVDRRTARARATELLEQFELVDAGDKQVRGYSGGMRRRLDLASSMILAPRVLFLDEPTTGLDPRSRSEVWSSVRSLVQSGTTVILTTQYLDEADQLADRIAVIDSGRKIADDTPDALKRAIGGDQIEVVVSRAEDLPAAERVIARVSGAEPESDVETLRVTGPVSDRVAALTEVARTLQEDGTEVVDIGLRRPTLDEVFLRLTGSRAGREAADGEVAAPRGEGDRGGPPEQSGDSGESKEAAAV